MALWLAVVIALTCVGGLVSPVPVYQHEVTVLQELIKELINITQNQKVPLCNGTMVWRVNLTTNMYCAAMEALSNVSDCRAIQNLKRIVGNECRKQKPAANQVSSLQVLDTKIELPSFLENLLECSRKSFRHVLVKL